MPHEGTLILSISRVVTLVLAALIASLAFKSYRRNRNSSMLYLGVSFTLISIAILAAGVTFEFLQLNLIDALTIEAVLLASAFLILIYSIYARD